MSSLLPILIPVGIAIIALLAIGLMLARLYQKSTREIALVKTGVGGRKVIIDGGTIAFPILHEITQVNMLTTRLEVRRTGDGALITKDRMRVDAGVEFYVAVEATDEGVAKAAQTLGDRTFDSQALREMIEGKLVDGLRSVAAQMDLDQLHENRSDFVQQVQNAVSNDLKKNGLALESVALTALDQTPMESLDENNVFNAVGLKIVAERAADSRKKRAEIEAEADLAVATAKQEAAVKTYQVEQDQEEARVAQQKRMNELKADEAAAKAEADERAARAARAAEIEREKAIRIAQEESTQATEMAEHDRKIAIAKKSEEESKAKAEADAARAKAVEAEEAVETARKVAEGERNKRLTLIEAEEQAEREATSMRVKAKAERDAANDQAASMREIAKAEADQITIRAEATKAEKLAEAEGIRAINDAENTVSAEILAFRLNGLRLEALPGILAEMMRPAEKIDRITMMNIAGLGGAGHSGGGAEGAEMTATGPKDPINHVFDQIRANAVALPALNEIGKQAGINVEQGLEGIMASVMPAPQAAPAKPVPADAEVTSEQTPAKQSARKKGGDKPAPEALA